MGQMLPPPCTYPSLSLVWFGYGGTASQGFMCWNLGLQRNGVKKWKIVKGRGRGEYDRVIGAPPSEGTNAVRESELLQREATPRLGALCPWPMPSLLLFPPVMR